MAPKAGWLHVVVLIVAYITLAGLAAAAAAAVSVTSTYLYLCGVNGFFILYSWLTRPGTQLPQSRAGGKGPYLRSLDHLGRSSEAIDLKNKKKSKV